MKKYHKSILGRFFKLLLTGIATFMPIGITIWFGWWAIKTSDIIFNNLVPTRLNPNNYLDIYIPGAGIVFTLIFFIILGIISRIFIGRWVFAIMDNIMIRLPIIKTIYNSIKTLTNTFIGDDNKAFGEPCLIQFPCENEWSVGFLTGSSIKQIQSVINNKNLTKNNDDYDYKNKEFVNVYVPTTPNPTSGYLLFVPKKDIILLEMTSDEALKLIISGGIVTPE